MYFYCCVYFEKKEKKKNKRPCSYHYKNALHYTKICAISLGFLNLKIKRQFTKRNNIYIIT